MTVAGGATLSFGDICTADFFYDAYLRADANALRAQVQTTDKAPWIKKRFQVDELTSYLSVDPDSPALRAQEGTDFLLAHGSRFDRALCLSDDCEIESRLGRARGEPSGHILFAPVTDLIESQRKVLTSTNWGRMLLPSKGSVIEIRRVFPVEAEDIGTGLADRSIRTQPLGCDQLIRLQAWWQAYSSRRGPLVSATNTAKLELALAAQSVPNAEAIRANLTKVLALAWGMEGRSIERAGQAVDNASANGMPLHQLDLRPLLVDVRTELASLREAAEQALSELAEIEPSSP